MRITFERTGGFAGMRMAITVDVDSLPEPDAAALRKLVKDTGFFNLSEARPERTIPDGFQYTIMVEGDGQQRSIQVTDASAPEKLRPLLDDLSLRARSQRAHS
jgi:hypothetical protein